MWRETSEAHHQWAEETLADLKAEGCEGFLRRVVKS